jgi:hypothetical protein
MTLTGTEEACINPDDAAILETTDVQGAAITCGIGCIADTDPETCMNTCVIDETGLSEDCTQCFTDLFGCTLTNCAGECIADPTSDACALCTVDSCGESFEDCSGIPIADTPPPEEQCTNTDDMAIIESTDTLGVATDCMFSCIADADPDACTHACIVDATGLSDGCTGCYVDGLNCVVDNCLVECAADPSSIECNDCMMTSCSADFLLCSGLEM